MRVPPEEDRAGSLGSQPGDGDRRRHRRCVGRQGHEPRRGGLENEIVPDAQGAIYPEGSSTPTGMARPACIRRGVWLAARVTGTTQRPGRTSFLLEDIRRTGGPVTRPRSLAPSACARYEARRTSACVRGRPKARETVAEAHGNEASEDCIRATTSGNGRHPDPIEQRRSVSRSNLRRETCRLRR
jgi:hypothetical protein